MLFRNYIQLIQQNLVWLLLTYELWCIGTCTCKTLLNTLGTAVEQFHGCMGALPISMSARHQVMPMAPHPPDGDGTFGLYLQKPAVVHGPKSVGHLSFIFQSYLIFLLSLNVADLHIGDNIICWLFSSQCFSPKHQNYCRWFEPPTLHGSVEESPFSLHTCLLGLHFVRVAQMIDHYWGVPERAPH